MVLYLFGNNKPAEPPNFLFSDWHKQKFFYLIPQIFLFFFSKKLLYQKEPDRGKIRDRVPFLFLKFFKFLSGPDFRLSAPGIALPTGADAPRSVPPLFGSGRLPWSGKAPHVPAAPESSARWWTFHRH